MKCENAILVHAYHDGELSSEQREWMESHLAVCAECRQLLEELRDLSQTLSTIDLPDMPAGALRRMQGAWWETRAAQEQGVRRLAGWLTAAAAAILVIVPVWSSTAPPLDQPIVATRSWEIMALVPPAGPRDDATTDLVQVAQWFATDLSTEQSQ